MKSILDSLKVKKINLTKRLILVAKIVFLLIAIVYIIITVQKQQGFNEAFWGTFYQLITKSYLYFIPLVLLMILNWLLEAIKWKFLLRPIKLISIKEAFSAVISGVTLSMITVGGIGDYLGRALFIEKKKLKPLVGITFIGSVHQNLVTYTAGGAGLVLFWEYQTQKTFPYLWLLLLIVFFVVGMLVMQFHKLKPIKFFKQYTDVLEQFSKIDKLIIFGYSFCRYILILIQYFLILLALEINIAFKDFFAGISLMLLSKSMIPRFSFLSDIGIREFSALFFFTKVGLSPAVIISSTLILWVLNIMIPAITGIFIILKKQILFNNNRKSFLEKPKS